MKRALATERPARSAAAALLAATKARLQPHAKPTGRHDQRRRERERERDRRRRRRPAACATLCFSAICGLAADSVRAPARSRIHSAARAIVCTRWRCSGRDAERRGTATAHHAGSSANNAAAGCATTRGAAPCAAPGTAPHAAATATAAATSAAAGAIAAHAVHATATAAAAAATAAAAAAHARATSRGAAATARSTAAAAASGGTPAHGPAAGRAASTRQHAPAAPSARDDAQRAASLRGAEATRSSVSARWWLGLWHPSCANARAVRRLRGDPYLALPCADALMRVQRKRCITPTYSLLRRRTLEAVDYGMRVAPLLKEERLEAQCRLSRACGMRARTLSDACAQTV